MNIDRLPELPGPYEFVIWRSEETDKTEAFWTVAIGRRSGPLVSWCIAPATIEEGIRKSWASFMAARKQENQK